jgi:transposase
MERSTVHLLAKRGKSQRTIARELGISRETVARVLRDPIDKLPSSRRRASVADPFEPQIVQWLSEGLSIVRMLEMARTDEIHPFTGSRSVFGDAVRRIRRQQAETKTEVPIRFEGLPGEYLQVDWGEIRGFPFTQQRPATRYFLACRLKFSRWNWIGWTADMRQETLLRGLLACVNTLDWVPWVLTFDNMKTVTSGRDDANQPIWTPALLHLAAALDFHPEACAVGAANQKGSVESLVKWVKGNFLAGRRFADDADLASQTTQWLASVNARPSAATGDPPNDRLPREAARGGKLPSQAKDYGLLVSGTVTVESVVHVAGNVYSVPVGHVGAPVSIRLHAERIRIWRDTTCLADHRRAPDGAQERVVEPQHFAPLFPRKERAQVMLYRDALLKLGATAHTYLSEVSRRRRARLRDEILAHAALRASHGDEAFGAALQQALTRDVYGAEYIAAFLTGERTSDVSPARLFLVVPGVPDQREIDRVLSSYEVFVEGAAGGVRR